MKENEEQQVPSVFREQETSNSNSPMGLYEMPLLGVNDLENQIPASASTVSFPATVRKPSIDDFPGQFDFNIHLSSQFAKAWRYSHLLKKLFVDKGQPICLDVTLSGEWTDNLFVRALPVYISGSYEEPVKRCPEHRSSELLNYGFNAADHIICVTNDNADYQKDPKSGRLSVVAPIPQLQPGTSSIQFMYTFVCRHSCNGGIARRSLAIVFTLETQTGQILGRRLLEVRVCSCPHRDMEKQEKAFFRSRALVLQESVPDTKSFIKEIKIQEQQEERLHNEHLTQASASNSVDTNCISIQVQEQLLAQKGEIKLLAMHLPEIQQQALSILWRDICENNQTLTELDESLLQIYRKGT